MTCYLFTIVIIQRCRIVTFCYYAASLYDNNAILVWRIRTRKSMMICCGEKLKYREWGKFLFQITTFLSVFCLDIVWGTASL